MMNKENKNIMTVPVNKSFLSSLAKWVLSGAISQKNNLSNILILLPNRRSARQLKDLFLQYSKENSILLPEIEAIGDYACEENLIDSNFILDEVKFPDIICEIEKKLILTKLVEKIYGRENLSMGQLARLAIYLNSFLSEIEKEELDVNDLSNLAPEEYANHWQSILKFLSIIIDAWPQILKEKNAVDKNQYRNLIIDFLCKSWQKNPPNKDIIIAGSTGSMPITFKLINVIANLPKGYVILPGLDFNLTEEEFANLPISHPQYRLSKILKEQNILRDEVKIINGNIEDVKNNKKLQFVSEVMRRGDELFKWQKLQNFILKDIGNLKLVNIANAQYEAFYISLKLKEILNSKDKVAALVTNNLELIRQIKSILLKWNIEIDDTEGIRFSEISPAVFMRLSAKMIFSNFTHINLFSCLGHKMHQDNAIRQIEKNIIRNSKYGVIEQDNIDDIISKLYNHPKLKEYLINIKQICEPLQKIYNKKKAHFNDILEEHISLSEKLSDNKLLSGDVGKYLLEFLEQIKKYMNNFGEIRTADYLGLLEAFLMGENYREKYDYKPRISILTSMESRLLDFDLVILGSMNEGDWPSSENHDPWMSKNMKMNFGLYTSDKKLGLSAHDFIGLLAQDNVIITRSEKINGIQTKPSKWLLRLETLLKKLNLYNLIDKQENWLKFIDNYFTLNKLEPLPEPMPKPKVEYRPQKFSATAIEKLLRDPYSVYAKYILNLESLLPIGYMPGPVEFGNFIHHVMEDFVASYKKSKDNLNVENFYNIGRKIINKYCDEHLRPFWWAKFLKIGDWAVQNELLRQDNIKNIISEKFGMCIFNINNKEYALYAKADRIEYNIDNTVNIIDYKTGTPPSLTNIKLGVSPQLIIEALIAKEGGFKEPLNIANIEYWRLSGGKIAGEVKSLKLDVNDAIEQMKENIISILKEYDNDNTPYLSQPNSKIVPSYNDYSHLAREQ